MGRSSQGGGGGGAIPPNFVTFVTKKLKVIASVGRLEVDFLPST